MAFQTNVFREGEWVTETVNINDVIKGNSVAKGPKKTRLLKPPRCGILTRTIVESPLINVILPVRLRTDLHNDVAFISSHAVYIREFCEPQHEGRLRDGEFREGHLRDIIQKRDFGSRIRNARVVGELPDDIIKNNDAVKPPAPSYRVTKLPPQLLVLILESGDCVFLFLRPTLDNKFEFVSTLFPSPLQKRFALPGFHVVIDPSSRYMALACAEDLFVIYHLESAETLNQRYMRHEPLNPVRSYHTRSVQGAIHKIEFLFPPPGHDYITLLVFVVFEGQSRIVTYDWRLGDDYGAVLDEEKHGHRMPDEYRLPTLLIPLKFKSAFMMISEEHIAVVTETSHGPPSFEDCPLQPPPASSLHHGQQEPLWTAWARPFRYSSYEDCIYLVREDGHIAFVEADSDGSITTSIIMLDQLDCHVDSAVSCLLGRSSEILVVGGSSGPGVMYRVPPRQPMAIIGTLPNWSPTVDFTTSDNFTTWNQESDIHGRKMIPWQERQPRKPDRIFATSGRGPKGCISEFRSGLEARIGVEIDYGDVLRQVWAQPVPGGVHLVLSMPGRSAALCLSQDLSNATEIPEDPPTYDLTSRTLALDRVDDHILAQVTERWVVVLSPDLERMACRRFSLEELLPDATPESAAVLRNTIAIAAHTASRFKIHIFSLSDRANMLLSPSMTFDIEGEVTCLSLDPWHGLVAAVWRGGKPLLVRNALTGEAPGLEEIDLDAEITPSGPASSLSSPLETIASIATSPDTIALGTRAGYVVTICSRSDSTRAIECRKFGFTSAIVCPATSLSSTSPSLLVCCDGNLILLSTSASRGSNVAIFGSRNQVWLVDSPNPSLAVPVDYAIPFYVPSQADNHDVAQMVVLSGSRVMFTDLKQTPGPVNRQIPVNGTPSRVLYSQYLQCLVVAVARCSKPTLVFLDPDTGKDRGRPVKQRKKGDYGEVTEPKYDDVDYISRLGQEGDKVFGLIEWEYKKDGNAWRYIVVTTHNGELVIISTAFEADGRIRYWTRQHRSFDKPVYSVAGHSDGLIYCVGKTVYWNILDTSKGRLIEVASYDLGSPATSLQPLNGKVLALTHHDSIEIIDREEAVVCHADPRTRPTSHWIELAGSPPEDPISAIILMADRECGLTGFFVPWQVPGRACDIVFEAELPSLIRTLRRGRTQPLWHQGPNRDPKFGRLISTLDDAEILGMGLDGSLTHLTRLNEKAWRLLRFIQNLAFGSEEIYPFTFQPDYDPEPRLDRHFEMHVDGDVLQRCLDKQALGRLVVGGRTSYMSRLVELLEGLDGGVPVANLARDETGQVPADRYLELAYDIIEYFVAPVM